MKNLIYTLLIGLACSNIAMAQSAVTSSAGAQQFYEEANKLKDNNKPAEALEKAKRALEINPNFTDALYIAGWCYNELKNYNAALDHLRKARLVWSAMPKVYFEIGYAFEKLKLYDSAAKNYYKCLELKPDYVAVYKQMGYMAADREDYNGALIQFRRYEDNSKTEINDYYYWYRKGFLNNLTRNYADAKTALQRSLTYKTDYLNTYLELGYAATRLKQDDEAIGYYKRAVEVDPKSYVACNGIGEVYRDNKKDMEQSMNWYRKALDINPGERKANFGMGYCLNSLQRYSEAAGYLQQAVQSEPAYTAAYVELGYSYYKLGRNTDAAAQFDKAISLSPKNESARYYACLMYIDQKNKTRAQQMVNELKSFSSGYAAELQPKVDAIH